MWKMIRHKQIFSILVLLGLCLATVGVSQVTALQVSPPKKLYVVDPGQVIQDKLQLIGTESKLTNVQLIVQEFRKEGEDNDRIFYTPEKEANTIGNWIKINVPLAHQVSYGQTIEVPFEIQIPLNAPPGGHYGTITAVLGEPERQGDTQVGVQSLVVAQLLVAVRGEIHEELMLESFDTEGGRRFFPHLPVNFVTRIRNTGNVHVIPKGFVEVFEGENKRVVLPVNPTNLEAFPQSVRRYSQEWAGSEPFTQGRNFLETFWNHVVYEVTHPQIGMYEVRLGAVYGPQRNIFLQDSLTIYVFPWHAVVFFIIVLFSIWMLRKIWKKWKEQKEISGKNRK